MDMFPRIGASVIDANRIDGAILTVAAVNYATGDVTVRLTTHADGAPYGRPAEGSTLTYNAPMARLTYA